MRPFVAISALLISLTALAACEFSSENSEGVRSVNSGTPAAPAAEELTPEPEHTDEVDQVSNKPTPTPRTDWQRDPYHDQFDDCRDRGYGGKFVQDGVVYYYFIDLPPEPHTPEVIRAAIAEHLCLAGNHSWAPLGRLGLAQGQYTMTELEEWRDQIHSPSIMGAVEWTSSSAGTGGKNRIEIGLSDLSAEPSIRAKMAAAGIPQDAVVFEESAGIHWGRLRLR